MVNKHIISFRIKPYAQESILQAGIDIVIMVLTITVLSIVKFPPIICILIVVGYLTVALAFHYRVLIQAFVDKRKGDFITETVRVQQFAEEYSFAGDRLGHSYVGMFYPKDKQVQKYRVKVVNRHGEKKELRSVMSFRRLLQFSVLDKHQTEYLQVVYLKRSKILIWCDLIEEIEKKPSRKEKEVIKKAIHFINMSI